MSLHPPTERALRSAIRQAKKLWSTDTVTLRVMPSGEWSLFESIQPQGRGFFAVGSISDPDVARKLIGLIAHQASRRVGGSV